MDRWCELLDGWGATPSRVSLIRLRREQASSCALGVCIGRSRENNESLALLAAHTHFDRNSACKNDSPKVAAFGAGDACQLGNQHCLWKGAYKKAHSGNSWRPFAPETPPSQATTMVLPSVHFAEQSARTRTGAMNRATRNAMATSRSREEDFTFRGWRR